MRFIRRLDLSRPARRLLAQRTEKVRNASDAKNEAIRLWRNKSNKAFVEIRERLREMATGVERCMYCEDSAGTDIEHFYPKSLYPERAFEWKNYLHACSHCNSNEKRGQFPLDAEGQPLLLNPTVEKPIDHLRLSPSTGVFDAASPKGDASIRVFGLSRSTLVKGRINAWVAMNALILRWASVNEKGDEAQAAEVQRALAEHPFSSVLAFLIRISKGPQAEILVLQEVLDVLQVHPEIETWLD